MSGGSEFLSFFRLQSVKRFIFVFCFATSVFYCKHVLLINKSHF